jgi:hypothetical protein
LKDQKEQVACLGRCYQNLTESCYRYPHHHRHPSDDDVISERDDDDAAVRVVVVVGDGAAVDVVNGGYEVVECFAAAACDADDEFAIDGENVEDAVESLSAAVAAAEAANGMKRSNDSRGCFCRAHFRGHNLKLGMIS